MLIIHMWDWPL